MNINNLSFGQRVDPSNGLIQPWFTHGALDKIAEMDLSDKVIWMFGAGLGDVWLANRCRYLYVVERNQEWLDECLASKNRAGVYNTDYLFRPCNDSDGQAPYYCEIPASVTPDIIIVDDAYRYECILKALEYKPCTLIVDNWQQDYVFICPSAEEVLREYKAEHFIQTDHADHEGHPWKTAIFHL